MSGFSPSELASRNDSVIVRCHSQTTVKVSGRLFHWPWKIRCGLCQTNIQLRCDASHDGRLSNFDRRKYMLLFKLSFKEAEN